MSSTYSCNPLRRAFIFMYLTVNCVVLMRINNLLCVSVSQTDYNNMNTDNYGTLRILCNAAIADPVWAALGA
jgi:hypothetical protein